jgi:hypothetical protein
MDWGWHAFGCVYYMKFLFCLAIMASVILPFRSEAQTPAPYQLPGQFQFDYDVTQVISDKKTPGDSCVMHFYFTKSGDYAGTRISPKNKMKGNLFILFTRDGKTLVFDEHHKNITIVSISKLMTDLAGMAKWIKMDSVMAHMHGNMQGKELQSVKTGKTMQTGSYVSEEYMISGDKGQASVWCAKVDFNTPADYIMGTMAGNMLKMMGGGMNGQSTNAHPLMATLMQPKTLVTAFHMRDSTGMKEVDMHTTGIDPTTMTLSTTGYSLSDYSNMSLPEIFQAEMKKRNND